MNISVRVDGYYPQLEDVIQYLDLRSNDLFQLNWLIDNELYPCWSCAEPEFDSINRFLIPIYNIRTSNLQSILISEEDDENFVFSYYFNHVYHTSMPNVDSESKEYWKKVEDFFNITTGFNGADVVFQFKGAECYRKLMPVPGGQMQNGCACNPKEEDEFPCSGGDQTSNCDGSKCPESGGGSSGTGGSGGSSDGGGVSWWPIKPNWEVFVSTLGGGSSTNGNGTNIDISNEEDVFNYVMWYLQTKVADDTNTVNGIPINEIRLLLGGNPELINPLFFICY